MWYSRHTIVIEMINLWQKRKSKCKKGTVPGMELESEARVRVAALAELIRAVDHRPAYRVC